MASKSTNLTSLIALSAAAGLTRTYGEAEFRLRPVTTAEYLILIRRFPILQSIIMGSDLEITDEMTDEEISAAESKQSSTVMRALIAEAPEALAAWIAVSIGNKNDAAVEEALLSVPDEIFFELSEDVRALTMPKGAQAFFLNLRKMAAILGEVPEAPTTEANDESVPLAA